MAEKLATSFILLDQKRKERAELLGGLVISNKDASIPNFPLIIHLLWGDHDQMFKMELAQNMKQHLGDEATYTSFLLLDHQRLIVGV